jgi:hypothetical protein
LLVDSFGLWFFVVYYVRCLLMVNYFPALFCWFFKKVKNIVARAYRQAAFKQHFSTTALRD